MCYNLKHDMMHSELHCHSSLNQIHNARFRDFILVNLTSSHRVDSHIKDVDVNGLMKLRCCRCVMVTSGDQVQGWTQY